jgi:hypothetical protein
MKIDWQHVLIRLDAYGSGVHRILPPCPEDRLEAVQTQFGKMPGELIEMLQFFNGGRLFINAMQLVSLFGISTIPPLPPFEWAPDWYIDKVTPAWRSSGSRENEWAIAMMNYGGLIILADDGTTKEWDTSQRTWTPGAWQFDEWMEKLLREGDAYMRE